MVTAVPPRGTAHAPDMSREHCGPGLGPASQPASVLHSTPDYGSPLTPSPLSPAMSPGLSISKCSQCSRGHRLQGRRGQSAQTALPRPGAGLVTGPESLRGCLGPS